MINVIGECFEILNTLEIDSVEKMNSDVTFERVLALVLFVIGEQMHKLG